MKLEKFLLKDKIEEIESRFYLNNGWLKIYETPKAAGDDSAGIYCCLVSNDHIGKYDQDYKSIIEKGSEGKPSVYGDGSYKTYPDEGVEPFLFVKHFSFEQGHDHYVDVAEEFVLYFRLYEQGSDKQNRTFYYVNDYGEKDEVLRIEPDTISVKIKYLKEYITIRDMHFAITYDFMRIVKEVPEEWEINYGDNIVKNDDSIYSHLFRTLSGRTQSWISGKTFIKPNESKKSHFDWDEPVNQDFIVDIDEEGDLIYENCGNVEGNHFTLTFFKKSVLDKYYNEPKVYKVDGFRVSSKFFSLKIDNNINDYVPVFLIELRMLPDKEQLHWKQYNIPPTEGMTMSRTYYKTMIQGEWADHPETPDLFFKFKYEEFNERWENKFGWRLYKPLSEKDEYLLTSLHVITSNNIKAFCEQALTVVKLTIDRLNEKELIKGLKLEAKVRGIGKFESFLKSKGMYIPDLFEFLRNLQNLRSGLMAHTFSESNKDCKNAMKYFELREDNCREVLKEIMIKSVYTFNTLEKYFELNEDEE